MKKLFISTLFLTNFLGFSSFSMNMKLYVPEKEGPPFSFHYESFNLPVRPILKDLQHSYHENSVVKENRTIGKEDFLDERFQNYSKMARNYQNFNFFYSLGEFIKETGLPLSFEQLLETSLHISDPANSSYRGRFSASAIRNFQKLYGKIWDTELLKEVCLKYFDENQIVSSQATVKDNVLALQSSESEIENQLESIEHLAAQDPNFFIPLFEYFDKEYQDNIRHESSGG